MKFGWQTKREKVLRWAKVHPEEKLEAIRLMNELADEVLNHRQKIIRQKLRQNQ